ncbi:MAG: CvpA family protein [Methylobacter sp.]|jgi:membrane protein required for colicin V production
MIWIDFAIIGLISISLITGLLNGFIKEVFSLGFWLLAVGVGLSFSRDLSGFLVSVISSPAARIAASFVILFVVTLTLGGLISFLLGALVKKTGLTFSDRLGGLIVGVARGMVVVTVVVVLAGFTSLPKDAWWTESKLIPPFQLLAVWLRDHIPSGMAEFVNYR